MITSSSTRSARSIDPRDSGRAFVRSILVALSTVMLFAGTARPQDQNRNAVERSRDQCAPVSMRTDDIYEAARLVPDDVDVFVCLNNAGPTLQALMKSEVAGGLRAFYERSNGGRSWREMSEELGLEPRELFRLLADRRLILITALPAPDRGKSKERRSDRSSPGRETERRGDRVDRGNRSDEDPAPGADGSNRRRGKSEALPIPWLAMSATEPGDFKKLINRLDCRVARWVDRIPVYEVRQPSTFEVAYRDKMMILGTTSNHELFDRVVAKRFDRPLADLPAFREAMQIEPGQVALFMREPEGGRPAAEPASEPGNTWQGLTVAVSPRGTRVEVRTSERAKQDGMPLSDLRKFEPTIDLSILENVNEGAICVFVEEFTTDANALGTMNLIAPFVRQQPGVMNYAGPTAFTIISSREPNRRTVESHADEMVGLKRALEPQAQQIAIAWGVELQQPEDKACRLMDELLISSLRALQVCIDNPEQLKIPDPEELKPGEMRWVDLTPCSKSLLEAVPGLEQMMLHWTMATADSGTWWVCSTDVNLLNETTAALRRRPRLSAERDEVAMGVIDGPAAATLLESWQEVNPRTDDPIFSRLFYLEEILKATPRIHWVVRRQPGESATMTTIKIDWGF